MLQTEGADVVLVRLARCRQVEAISEQVRVRARELHERPAVGLGRISAYTISGDRRFGESAAGSTKRRVGVEAIADWG